MSFLISLSLHAGLSVYTLPHIDYLVKYNHYVSFVLEGIQLPACSFGDRHGYILLKAKKETHPLPHSKLSEETAASLDSFVFPESSISKTPRSISHAQTSLLYNSTEITFHKREYTFSVRKPTGEYPSLLRPIRAIRSIPIV